MSHAVLRAWRRRRVRRLFRIAQAALLGAAAGVAFAQILGRFGPCPLDGGFPAGSAALGVLLGLWVGRDALTGE